MLLQLPFLSFLSHLPTGHCFIKTRHILPVRPEQLYTLKSPHTAVETVLLTWPPVLQIGSRIHFHTCWIGRAFNIIVDRMNSKLRDSDKNLPGPSQKHWYLSGYTQAIQSHTNSKTLEFISTQDIYVHGRLLECKALTVPR